MVLGHRSIFRRRSVGSFSAVPGILFDSPQVHLQRLSCSFPNVAFDGFQAQVLVRFETMASRESVIRTVHFKHVDGHLQSNLGDAFHQPGHFGRIVTSGASQRPAYALQWDFCHLGTRRGAHANVEACLSRALCAHGSHRHHRPRLTSALSPSSRFRSDDASLLNGTDSDASPLLFSPIPFA